MSVDPRDLGVGDRVVFSKKVVERVMWIDYDKMEIGFHNGDVLKVHSYLWKLTTSAEYRLKLLKKDVRTLEAVGVEEEK